MITPAYGLTATERILPQMALDFTTAVLDARVSVSRALNTATRINSSGVIELVNADLPRFNYSPTSIGTCLGLLVETSRENLFLNSLIDGTNLSTQSVTLAATPYALSFYGTGSIDISGGHSATVNGTGAYPSRVTYIFTPTAGSSTFTVTGDVKYAQIEAGSFSTSFIPTAGASVVRNADTTTMSGTNFSSWFNASEGTFVADWVPGQTVNSSSRVIFADNTSTGQYVNYIFLQQGSASTPDAGARGSVRSGNTTQADLNIFTPSLVVGTTYTACLAYAVNNFAFCFNGGALETDLSGIMPVGLNILRIGYHRDGSYLNGCVSRIFYFNRRITNAEVQAFGK